MTNPIVNMILNIQRFETILITLQRRQSCLLYLVFFNIMLDALARAIRQKKEIKGIQIGK